MATGSTSKVATAATHVEAVEPHGIVKLIGSLDNFVPSADFDDYMERAENFFELNSIVDNAFKRKLIVHFIGLPALRKLQQLLYPKTHKEVSYEVVVSTLKAYFSPKRNRIAQSVEFFKRNQHEFEKVADYAVELQSLSKYCSFGDFLDKALRDKFIAGILNTKIQGELMNSADDSTFEQAVEKAKILEQIEDDLAKMKLRGGTTNRINSNAGSFAVKDRAKSRGRSQERRRTEDRQSKSQSRSHYQTANKGNESWKKSSGRKRKFIRCFNCSRMGHIAKFCRFPKQRTHSMTSFTDDDDAGSSSSNDARAHGVNHVASSALFHQL